MPKSLLIIDLTKCRKVWHTVTTTTKGHTIKTETRQFLSVVTLATLGVWFIVSETHRVVIGWAWNLFVAFHDTYIAF